MKYLTMILSFITSFTLAMLCIQTIDWDDGLPYTILTLIFAGIFFTLGLELRSKE